jgi:hypothetical protein
MFHLSVLAVALLGGCRRTQDLPRPRPDPALHEGPAGKAVDFARSKPALLPASHAPLTLHWEGLRAGSFPDGIDAEMRSWIETLPRERRRDPAAYRPNGVPVDWKPARTWYAGAVEGGVQLLFVTLGESTFAFGATPRVEESKDSPRASLGWASSAQPAEIHWIQREIALPEHAQILRYDVETHDGAVVLVCAVPAGLREIVLEAEGAGLRIRRDRQVGPAKAFDPMLLDAGGTLLLFWSEHERSGKGLVLRVTRLLPGAQDWSAPATLTTCLGGRRAACVRGGQVTATWADDRFREYTWSAFVNTDKLCVARSVDGGATWSAPVLLHAPKDKREGVAGTLRVLDDGSRVFVLDSDVIADAEERSYVLSRDLTRVDPHPADLEAALLRLRRDEIAAMDR